jgi:hypothetical protein
MLGIACGTESPPAPGAAATTAEPSRGLDFTVTTFEGETFRLADQRGTPVVLNFWESW